MADHPGNLERVRFYGAHDLAAGLYLERVAEIALRFDPAGVPTDIMDVLELHNVQQYLQHVAFSSFWTPQEAERMAAATHKIPGTIGRFFGTIDESNFAATVSDVDMQYRGDFLDLLDHYKAFDRLDSSVVLPALKDAGVPLREMLARKSLVDAYGTELREELLDSGQNAEILVHKHLERSSDRSIQLPKNLTAADSRRLLERYLDEDGANLNYVRLIADSRNRSDIGIDGKLRLSARRRAAALSDDLFTEGTGLRTGVEVAISDEQEAPVDVQVDTSQGWTQRYSYSKGWFDQTLDYPSVLNNFQHLFQFTNEHVILTFPAYPAELGVMERLIGITGTDDYTVGTEFRTVDMSSLLQTQMYGQFLRSNEIDIEDVIRWFCETYLLEEFGARHFSFNPSAPHAPYLQKVRHLFAEMESLAHQFALFAEDGELDRELLTVGSDIVRYGAIPSLVEGKYVYASDSPDIARILYLLFSDQSMLQYINEDLKAHSAAALLMSRSIAYEDFHHYQAPNVDFLIQEGILMNDGASLRIASNLRLFLLSKLHNVEAVSYYYLSEAGRAEVEAMVEKGWVSRHSSLLTRAEGDYFNYFLNNVSFSNGPNLRNRYLHGSQPDAGEGEHFKAYVTALRLTVALVIKINDDFCLSATVNL